MSDQQKSQRSHKSEEEPEEQQRNEEQADGPEGQQNDREEKGEDEDESRQRQNQQEKGQSPRLSRKSSKESKRSLSQDRNRPVSKHGQGSKFRKEEEQKDQNKVNTPQQPLDDNVHQKSKSPILHANATKNQQTEKTPSKSQKKELGSRSKISGEELKEIKKGAKDEGKEKVEELQLTLDDKLREIKQLKEQLKKEKEKSKLLEIQLGALKSEHAKCTGQPNKDYRPLPPSRNLAKEQKGIVGSRRGREQDEFWNIEPPEVIRRKNQQQVYGGRDITNLEEANPMLLKPKQSKNSHIALKQSQIRVKKLVSHPSYDDDEVDFWNANLPQSLNKRKQDLIHDSNLWINQMQVKNTKLPALSAPLKASKK